LFNLPGNASCFAEGGVADLVKRIGTPAALVLVGLWLAPASSAGAAPIIELFSSDDTPCRQQSIIWMDLSPAGMGAINPLIRLDRETTDECEDDDRANRAITSMDGGGSAGGFGGLVGGASGARSSGVIAPNTGPLASDDPFAHVTPPDWSDPGSPFGNTTIVRHAPSIHGPGGNLVLALGSSVMTIPLSPGGSSGGLPPGNPGGRPALDDPSLAVVPEPGTILLFGTGLIIAARRLRRRIP